jgi:bacillithiol biosynthesis cysteine-adding enzyme BshC
MSVSIERIGESPAARPLVPRVALVSEPHASEFAIALDAASIEPRPSALDLDDRGGLATELESRLAPLAPHVAVLDSIRALRDAGACCVVTGQQPGLLAAPLYSLYKALHAVRLARTLALRWERPVVPIFWNHADDHDVAEVHHAWMLNENFDLQRLGLAGLSSGRTPLSRIVFHEERHQLSALRAALEQMLARAPHADRALELFLPRDGESFAGAFTRTMQALLGHLGLVVVEPDWIRERISRALARAVVAPLQRELAAGEAALRERGIEPAIAGASAALLYRVDGSGRHALRFGGDGFQYEGESGSRSGAELAAEILDAPHAWSPGALLRPIAQDECLPSVAYVGGATELAYLAQLGPLRRALSVPRVPAVARWSCTLVDPDTSEALAQLGERVETVLSARRVPVAEQGQAPPDVVVELRRIAEQASRAIAAQKPALAEIDTGLAQTLARTASQIRSLVETTCEKAERAHANRRGRGRRLVRRVENTLAPRGELQERVLGPLPFVARFGTDWIDELFERLAAFEPGHVVARIDGDPLQTKASATP